MKIAYVTAQLPYGLQETFIIPEIREVQRLGNDAAVLPLRPGEKIFHEEADFLRENSVSTHLFSAGVFREFVTECVVHPLKAVGVILRIIRKSRNMRILLKNLVVVPRGFYFARIVRRCQIQHIHAHWASTPSTVAYIASALSDIPWSFTAHRWDISENNLLSEKCKVASFVRSISETGKKEILHIIKDESIAYKVDVIHMGVEIPGRGTDSPLLPDVFTFLCPANFVHVKGHDYLFEACSILNLRGVAFKCFLAGDGARENELKKCVRDLELGEDIQFLGRLPHERIISLYERGEVHAVVLPSVETVDGEKEGIPVALMEAMAYGIPVISTDTGGIPELLDGAGVVIPQKDPIALADAIERITKDDSYRDTLRTLGRERVLREFNLSTNVERLVGRMREN